MSTPFPRDRRPITRCVRAFMSLMAERLEHGRDVHLPNDVSIDRVLCGLALHEANWDATSRDFELVDDEGEAERFAEIADTLREVFDDLSGPSPDSVSVN